MRKYTVIYSDSVMVGSHVSSIVKLHYIECEKENLERTVEEQIGWGSVWFILDGHCEQSEVSYDNM